MSTETAAVRATAREISHRVYIDLPDRPVIKTPCGGRRKLYGLRLDYGIRRDVSRVDVDLVFHNSAEHFPPEGDMPEWLRRIVDAHRPADVDSPDANRRTGMGGWPLAAPTVPAEDPEWPSSPHDPAALHDVVARGLRALGFSYDDAAKYAAAHRQDAFDVAGDVIDSEAWPHEKPESENEDLYRLANKVRNLCWCGREKQSGENHGMCYPGME